MPTTPRPDSTKAEVLGVPAKSSQPDLKEHTEAVPGLDEAILEGEREATSHEQTERQAVAMATSARGETVIPEVTSSRDQAMLDAAAGRKVSPVPFADPSRAPGVLGGGGSSLGVPTWNGVATRFTLTHPVMHNQVLLKEGDTIDYNVNAVMAVDSGTGLTYATGRFIGSGGPDDESDFVTYMFERGMFAGTLPADIRASKQAAIDNERGVIEPTRLGADEAGNAIMQPAMRSLLQPTGAQMEQRLRDHRGIASPAAMLQAERMASSAGAEAPGSSGPRPQRSE
jgi:hypothetical protein